MKKTSFLLIALLATLVGWGCSLDPVPEQNPEPGATRPPAQATRPATATSTPAPTTTPTPPVSALGVDPADLQGLTVHFWHVWSWEVGEALQDLVTDFNASNPYGIRVEAISQGGYADLSERLLAVAGVDELPDLVVGFNNQIMAWDAGPSPVADLNPYLTDPEWGLSPLDQGDFFPAFLEQDLAVEKRLGLPAQRSAQFLVYNLTWAEELGFNAPPSSLDEFQAQACAAAEANMMDSDSRNDGTGGWVINTSASSVLSWVYAFGGQISTETGYDFDRQEPLATFSYLKSLFDQGCAWLSKNRFPDPDFANRRALLTASSTASLPFVERALLEADSQDTWTVIPFPADNGQPVTTVSGPSYAVLQSTSERQLATWLVIKWLLEPENQARWIRVSGSWPSRSAALDQLEDYRASHPQWGEMVDLLPFIRGEPARASWGTVRWALSDAAEQIFRLNLSQEQIPALLKELDQTAAELNAQWR